MNASSRAIIFSLATLGKNLIDTQAIRSAGQLIRPYIRRTPVVAVDASDFGLASGAIRLKLELMQHAGSFKVRGAFTNLLSRTIPDAGIAAASGGNHGAAVAYAAQKLKVHARIFVPTVASAEKIDRIRQFGAHLVIGGDRYADALAACDAYVRESGAMSIHAYDQAETMIGQGTVALEFEEQAPDLDTLFVAVGGGGLIGGIASWYADKIADGKLKLVGVEPEAAPTLERALAAGAPVDAPAGGIASDSLAPRRVGALMFPIAQKNVSTVVLVSDSAIAESQAALWRVLRIAAEPGGAAAFAALLSRKYIPRPGEKVGVLVCGGNTTAVNFSR
jgi:threonine dehydratase